MLFNSLPFLFFFLPITYVVFWTLRSAQSRYVWLTVTGYVFYGYWDARFCLLMALSTLVSYLAGLGFLRFEDPRHRRLCLIAPITIDLALLGFFKYAGFALHSVQTLARALGANTQLPELNIILPIGISFYTFHTISYIVDSYRRVIVPTRNLFEFAAYVSLFSQLVAGPIVRFRQIEEDLSNLGSSDRCSGIPAGACFFVIGLVEKVLLADGLAAYVDPGLLHYENLSSGSVWLCLLGYTFQLYFDFCGYSDMAVGLGLFFGLRIPQNFDSPYKALDPSDFWKRWHISLSSCLRDYLYIPLGGNRGSAFRTHRNLMLTMLIGGLWHGASWTFVCWGAYHGALLILYRQFQTKWDSLPRGLRRLLMFALVLVGWVFFRATDFPMVAHLLGKMFVPTQGASLEGTELLLSLLAIAGVWSMLGPNCFELAQPAVKRTARFAIWASAAFGACFAIIASGKNSPFLYFQF